VYAGVRSALRLGYTHLDTALGYQTQRALARAVNDSGVLRSSLFIVSKVPGHLDGPGAAAAIASCVAELGAPIDLMLIHYPGTWSGNGSKATRQATWLELEKAWRAGRLRSIGVSHFCPRHLEDVLEVASVPVAANQVEYHVGMGPSSSDRTDDPAFDRAHHVTHESFMPLCGQCGDDELVTGALTNGIGAAPGKSGAQAALRWLVQQGIPAIPRSGSAAHQRQNLDIFDFALSDDEMAQLSAFTKPKLVGEGGDCDVP
jgi:diketogulonate reductase-like aldo/keto reductase